MDRRSPLAVVLICLVVGGVGGQSPAAAPTTSTAAAPVSAPLAKAPATATTTPPAAAPVSAATPPAKSPAAVPTSAPPTPAPASPPPAPVASPPPPASSPPAAAPVSSPPAAVPVSSPPPATASPPAPESSPPVPAEVPAPAPTKSKKKSDESDPGVYWNSNLVIPIPETITHLLRNWTQYTEFFRANGKVINKVWGSGNYKKPPSFTGVVHPHHQTPEHTYFVEQSLKSGFKIGLDLHDPYFDCFFPREASKLIPFSTSHLPEILKQFSLLPNSPEAKVLNFTLQHCEESTWESSTCATSLESMIDYVIEELGSTVAKVLSTTTIGGGRKSYQVQNYTTVGFAKNFLKLSGGEKKLIACHKLPYAYAVYQCHELQKTRVHVVTLQGENAGAAVKAVAVCHADTSEWSPKHNAFLVLGVKRGTVPICHFLPENDLLWYNY